MTKRLFCAGAILALSVVGCGQDGHMSSTAEQVAKVAMHMTVNPDQTQIQALQSQVMTAYLVYSDSSILSVAATFTSQSGLLTVNPNGLVTAGPEVGVGQVVTATYGGFTATAFVDVVLPGPPVQSGSTQLPGGIMYYDYVPYQLTATGSNPLAWSAVDGYLPSGMSLGADGIVSGVPYEYGTFFFTARVTDAFDQFTDVEYSLMVDPDFFGDPDPVPLPAPIEPDPITPIDSDLPKKITLS